MDLELLQRFLQSAGYGRVLPSNKYCVWLIPFIRANLDAPPGRNIFPAKLEIVFPLLFPLHQFVGVNHNALPDCLQT